MNRFIQPATAFCTLLSAFCLAQTVPLRWAAELGDARPARFTLVRGDTVELAADLFAEGRPYLPATADAALLWQTNGMGALWWEVPASVASNRVAATWTPAMDTGAASYLAHFRVGSSTGSVFRAYARLAMQHGPGDPVNALPLPVPVIDFAKVVVTNAPWSEGGGGLSTNDVRAIIEADAGPTNNIVRADQYGNVTVQSFLDVGDTITLKRGGNLSLTSNPQTHAAELYGGEWRYTPLNEYGPGREIAVKDDLAPLARSDSLGTAAYKDASEFATAADEALVYQLLTNRLSGVTFDFATVAGLYLAISNIVAAQGGAITNFPVIP